MVEPQKLSERLRDAVDFGPVKYGHSGYVEGLLTLVSEVEALESRLSEAQKSGKLFCEEQCEEGPGWGECEDSGCYLFSIKRALRGAD